MRSLLISCSSSNAPEKFALARTLGLGMQIQAFYAPENLMNPDPELVRHQELLSGFTAPIVVHGAFAGLVGTSLDPLVRQVATHRIKQVHSIAVSLGAGHVVQHCFYSPLDIQIAGWEERALNFWDNTITDIPDGLTMLLENTFEDDPEIIRWHLEELAHPRLGFCFDVGHTQAFSTVDPLTWVKTLGSYINCVHLHDNDGSADQHLPLGQGTLPLKEMLDTIEAVAPDALWIIEEGDTHQSLEWLVENGYISCTHARGTLARR